MKKCLVTGSTGLIGSRLLPLLNEEGWAVSCMQRGNVDEDRAEVINIDLSDNWSVADLPEKVDAVVHLAQSEDFRDFPHGAMNVFNVNTATTARLLDYAVKAGAETFVYASSGGVYGTGESDFSEDAEISSSGDLGYYLGTKLCSEILASCYAKLLNVVSLRFFFVYGPGQNPTMLIPRLVNNIKQGKPLQLQGEDGIRINPTYVADAAKAIQRALHLGKSHKINVGGPDILTLREVGEIIGEHVGRSPEFEVSDCKPNHLAGSIDKMSRLLGTPDVGFEEGIKRYLQSLT